MWASLVKAFSGLVSFLGALVEWRREAQLRDDGAARESLKMYTKEAHARTLADEIDRRPEFTNRRELLDRLRKQQAKSTPHQLGQTNPSPRGDAGVAQWSQG